MTKEQILEKSRNENKGADLATLDAQRKSMMIAGSAALTLGALMNFICQIKYDQSSPIFWVMFFGYSAAQGISYFILSLRRTGSLKWVYIAYGVFMLIMTVLAVIKMVTDFGQVK